MIKNKKPWVCLRLFRFSDETDNTSEKIETKG